LEFVTLNTSPRELNHHQFKKADDAPQKNIKLFALLQKENKYKLTCTLAQRLKVLAKYNTPSAGVLLSGMAE
jgi:hypothetical protein